MYLFRNKCFCEEHSLSAAICVSDFSMNHAPVNQWNYIYKWVISEHVLWKSSKSRRDHIATKGSAFASSSQPDPFEAISTIPRQNLVNEIRERSKLLIRPYFCESSIWSHILIGVGVQVGSSRKESGREKDAGTSWESALLDTWARATAALAVFLARGS